MVQRILIVDDDKEIVEVYKRALEKNQFEVLCAYDGGEGLDLLKKNKIDLVVLDLKMPKMRGDEFLKIVRNDNELKDIKVLVISSAVYNYKKEGAGFINQLFNNVENDIKEIKTGKSKIALKAEEFGKIEKKFDIDEKPKPKVVDYSFLGPLIETDPKFKRRTGVELVEKVKKILA